MAPSLLAGSISGTVRSSMTGAPLSAMVAALYDNAGNVAASATTDSNGRYQIAITGGQYRLLVYDPQGIYATAFDNDAESFETSPILNVGTSVLSQDFSLQRAGTVSGIVRVQGQAAAGVTVAAYNLSGTRRGFALTNAQGFYTIVLPPGRFKLGAYDSAGRLSPLFYPGTSNFVDAGVIEVSSSVVYSGKAFDLAYAAHLAGMVVDRLSGMPLPSITVDIYNTAGSKVASTTSDANGHFSAAVPAGSYRLVSSDARAVYASAFPGNVSSFNKSNPVTVDAGQTSADILISMDRGVTVTGGVTDNAGVPLAGIHVAAYNDDGTLRAEAFTDQTGAYTLVVPAGSFRFAGFDDHLAYATEFFQQSSSFGAANRITILNGQTAPPVNFQLTRAGHVIGTVTDSSTGTPVAGITVAAYDSALNLVASATSSSAGQYTLALPPGTFRLLAFDSQHNFANSFDGGAAYYEMTAARTIASDTDQNANFSLQHGMQIRGIVSSVPSNPLRNIEVDVLDLQGHHVASAVTIDDGSFIITVLPATYKILLRDPAGQYQNVYYNGASTLANASEVVVSANSPSAPLNISLPQNRMRRRAVGH